ncbi:DNA-directed RNA polymerase I subunit RPA43 isoform X2 [Hoplias malabaricus]
MANFQQPGASGDSPGILPSFAEACALVQSPYSCLVLDTRRRHILLSPFYLNKKRTGIQQELNTELLKYSNSVEGVPLAYDDIKVLGHRGDIFDDQGFIHLDIEASFVIFKPKIGQKLVGVINKISVGHVGCLVHGCFNACVVKPASLTPEQWRDSGLMVGSPLEFEVFQLDADVAGVLLIRGRLGKARVKELVASFSNSENLETEPATEPDATTTEELTEGSGASKPKKKKKKRDKEVDREEVEDLNGNRAVKEESIAVEIDSNNSKEKKKKKKDKTQEAIEELPLSTDLLNSDSSGYISDKINRKRKAKDSEGLQDNSDTPVSKKKKKTK